MTKIEIRLRLAENVKTFVNVMNHFSFEMDLRAGRHVVDAKSILGIFSLALSKPITLEFDETAADPAEVERLLREIQPFLTEA